MRRRIRSCLLAWGGLPRLLQARGVEEGEEMPDPTNVLFILSDDQGVWAAGCYGIRRSAHRISTGLPQAASASRTSSAPRRSARPPGRLLLTGRIPSQHGVHDWIRAGNVGPDAIRYLEGELTYTDILARAGWSCGLSGKWHLGDSQIPQHGFTDWFAHQFGGGDYHNAPMVRNGQLIQAPGYVTDVITDEALALLERYADAGAPSTSVFIIPRRTAPGPATHREIVDLHADCPFNSCARKRSGTLWAISLTDECLGNRAMLQGYFAAVTAMDMGIGRLLDRLEGLGLRERTLVVFMSDNGFSAGHHGFWGKGNGTVPRNMYENSIRVPAILQPPRRDSGRASGAGIGQRLRLHAHAARLLGASGAGRRQSARAFLCPPPARRGDARARECRHLRRVWPGAHGANPRVEVRPPPRLWPPRALRPGERPPTSA